ncbi:MAG TPA: hypothetical protein VFG23_18480 [Polyangia bacterium]|nr:hypothetical protein [Polyangia bacterium]
MPDSSNSERATKLKKELAELPVSKLLLDPENPRLPEELQGEEDQQLLLEYFFREGVLLELAQSLVDNGYFTHEPLIALKAEHGKYLVLEGNRRLATLFVLLGQPAATAQDLTFDLDISKDRVTELGHVPCYVVDSRDDAQTFLGFRHIGGIKKWPADAKARYLAAESDRIAKKTESDPFYVVGRQVGSNAQGIRNYYSAIGILRHARDEFGIDTVYIVNNRFGVWLRCMNSAEIKNYIGFNGARSYPEVRKAFQNLRKKPLVEVLGDLQPREELRAVLQDSRDVTDYGRILANDLAHRTLRRFGDFTVARQVISEAELPVRLKRLATQIEVITSDLGHYEVAQDVVDATDDVYKAARSLRATAQAALKDPP